MADSILYTIQLVFIFATVIVLMAGFFRLGLVSLKLPKSEFQNVFGMLALSYLFLAPLVFGFAIGAVFDLKGSGFGRSIQMYWGMPGVLGLAFLMIALIMMMRYLGGGKD